MSGVAYLVECLNKYSVDICALQEHWLRGHCAHMLDSIDPFYQSVNTKCVDDNNPTLIKTRMEGGVTFIVKSSILKYVECIELDEKRITGIEIPTLNSREYFVFVFTYLQHPNPSSILDLTLNVHMIEMYTSNLLQTAVNAEIPN
jgi:hypothetical protein